MSAVSAEIDREGVVTIHHCASCNQRFCAGEQITVTWWNKAMSPSGYGAKATHIICPTGEGWPS